MDLSYQCHIHIEDGRNYVMLHKFHIQVNKKATRSKTHQAPEDQAITRYTRL